MSDQFKYPPSALLSDRESTILTISVGVDCVNKSEGVGRGAVGGEKEQVAGQVPGHRRTSTSAQVLFCDNMTRHRLLSRYDSGVLRLAVKLPLLIKIPS